MNRFAAVLVLLGVFWTQTSALETYALQEPQNDYVTGTMTIDNDRHIVDVHVRSGVYSSDTIFDYLHFQRLVMKPMVAVDESEQNVIDLSEGYIATRLFSRNACFIMKIDKQYIPDLHEMGRLAFERQTMNTVYSPNNVWVQFQSGDSRFGRMEDWVVYGKPIEQLCTGLPLYQLAKTAPLPNVHGCASAGIPSILGIKICEKINHSAY